MKNMTKNMATKRIAVIVFTILILLSGCRANQTPISPTDTSSAAGEDAVHRPLAPGGSLYMPVYNFDTWNPIMTKSLSVSQVSTLVYEGLFDRNPDFSMSPCLAEGYSVSDNALTYTFFLHKNIQWHDGSSFNASDVEYTIGEIMKNESIFKMNVENIASTKVVNNYTYSITLKKPMSGFITFLDFPIIKNKTNDPATIATYIPMGTGRYKYMESSLGKEMTLKAIGSHWSGSPANIDTIKVKQLPDKESVKFAFDAREVETQYLTPVEMMTYSPKAHAKSVLLPTNNITFIGINTNHEALVGASTRRAISMLIDREYITKNIMIDRAYPATVPINPRSWLYPDNASPVQRDVDAAKELFSQDGWTVGENGLMQKPQGNVAIMLQFTIILNEENSYRTAIAETIKKSLSETGITVNIEKLKFQDYQKRVSEKRYDMYIGEVAIAANNDISMFGGKEAHLCVYKNEAMNILMDNAQNAKTNDEIQNAYRELGGAFTVEMPIITLFFGCDSLVYNDKIRGEVAPAWGNVYGNLPRWYVN